VYIPYENRGQKYEVVAKLTQLNLGSSYGIEWVPKVWWRFEIILFIKWNMAYVFNIN
jgi:hypothetical protein